MNTPLTSVLVVFVTFTVLATAQQCQDRMTTKTCQYFIKMYREKKIDSCKWKQMTTNCALSCKVCVPLPKCATVASRYGCCWDNKTEAKSYAGEGCPECKDSFPSYCRQRISRFTKEKACNERGTNMCPKSCGTCRVQAFAPALPDCLNSPYGCCWDLTAALGPRGKGCTVCKDNYHRLCSLFSGYCKEEVYKFVKKHVVDRYRKNCPKTCGKCTPGQKKLDVSVYLRRL